MPSTTLLADRFERKFVRPAKGRTLIVGSYVTAGKTDRREAYPDAVGFDMREGFGVDRVIDLEEKLPPGLGRFAHVECWSVLEHSRRPWLLAANIERLMNPGATIHLSVPFIWRFHDYPSDFWRFTAEAVREMFRCVEWEHLMYAGDKLRPDTYLQGVQIADTAYLPRTEVLGFGRKR